MPGLLSQVVTLIRDSEYEASVVLPGLGSNIRHPLSVFPSLHRVPRDQFPGFIGNMKVLRLPAAHLAALRFLRLAIPRLHSLCSLLGGRVRRQGQELVTRYLRPGFAEEASGSPKFLENLNCSFAMFQSDAGRTACTRPIQCSSVAPGMQTAKAPTKGLSALNSIAFGLAVYASPGSLPSTTQDSLPVAGQALDGVFTRKIPMTGFKVVNYVSSPYPKLLGVNASSAASKLTRATSEVFSPAASSPPSELAGVCPSRSVRQQPKSRRWRTSRSLEGTRLRIWNKEKSALG